MRTKIAAFVLICAAASYWSAPARAQAPASPPMVSLNLDQAVQAALQNNLTYRSALADEKIAAAQVVQAASGRLPSLSVGYARQHTQSAGSFNIPTPNGTIKVPISATNYDSTNETLQWAIFTGGAVEAAVGQASAGYSAAQSRLQATRADVVRDTTNAYFQLIEARRSASIADQAVAVAQDDLKTAQELFAAGTAARADVLRQQVTLANAQVQQVQAGNAASLANARLANVLNIDLGSTIAATEPLEAATPAYQLDALLGGAHANRQELSAARQAVTIADDAVKAARAGTLPTVAVAVQNASLTPNFQNIPQPQLSETLSVTWKLFDGGLTHGKVAEATADVDKAKINLQQLENGVDLEVREAYFNYVAAQAQVAAARSARASADENLRVERIRYRSGVGTSLELSDALLANTQAQNQLVNSLANLRIALVALQRATGVL
ncbi:MAG TPA: TolC family protein [Candidatus Eremiobacteraceae bacterium]|nr:TolC family protein [Candidatus Eremiobacteraceae bacterium]